MYFILKSIKIIFFYYFKIIFDTYTLKYLKTLKKKLIFFIKNLT
jgi:hypothetical protein